MYKLLLFTLSIGTFLNAEYMSESDLLMQQNLEDIRKKYHIQGGSATKVLAVEKEVLEIKEEIPKPNVSLRTHKSSTEDDVLTSVKQFLPSQNKSNVSQNEKNEDRLKKIRRELGINELRGKEKKLEQIRNELDINYAIPKKESSLDKHISSIQKALHMDGEIEGEYSFSNSVRNLKKTLHLDSASSWDLSLPSFFADKKKKKKSSMFGLSIFADVQDTGQSIYKGMKYSGQSAELMSGMMYNSSKIYNTMFGVFDDSPFNIFKEEEEASVFDFVEGGNSIMRMFE